MKEKMHIHYDQEGDYLEVRFGELGPAYYEDIGDDIFERRDEETDEIKGYAIFNIIKRREKQPKDIIVDLPEFN